MVTFTFEILKKTKYFPFYITIILDKMDLFEENFSFNLNDPYYNSHNHNSHQQIKTYVDPLSVNKILIDKPIDNNKYIYQSRSSWLIRQGSNTFGRFKSHEEALEKRNELIKDGIIKTRKISQKPKKITKQLNSTLLNHSEQINYNNAINNKNPTNNNEDNNKNAINDNGDNNKDSIETIQIYNYINELNYRREEMKKHQNQIKVNMKRILKTIIRENTLRKQLEELNKRQEVLSDFVNIVVRGRPLA